MNIGDEPAHWPVVSTAELARGRLVTVRTDKVRMPDGELAEPGNCCSKSRGCHGTGKCA